MLSNLTSEVGSFMSILKAAYKIKFRETVIAQAYSPIGSANSWFAKINVLELPIVTKFAEKYGKTPAQIALRWNVQQGHSVLPKSTNADRIASNIGIFDFEISYEDLQEFNKIEQVNYNSTWIYTFVISWFIITLLVS